MRQTFVVTLVDGTVHTIEGDGRDVRAWEAEYEQSFLSTAYSLTMITQLAYLAGKRTGVLNGQFPTYADFDAACVDARGKVPRPIANPTQPVATDARYASSPTGSAASRPPSKRKAAK